MNVRALLYTALFAFAGLAGCSPESIVIAHGPDAGDDAAPFEAGPPVEAGPLVDASGRDSGWSGFGPPCASNDDCRPGHFCEKASCGDPIGGCVEQPTFCSGVLDPVCGCDGISYWNECARRLHGAVKASEDECRQTAKRCGLFSGLTCPSDTHCAMLLGEATGCDPNAFPPSSKCWGLPPDCSGAGSERYVSCVPISADEKQCVNACEAIGRELPHAPSRSCRDRPPGGP